MKEDMSILTWIWLAGCVLGALSCGYLYYRGWKERGRLPHIDFIEAGCIVFVMVMFWGVLTVVLASLALYFSGSEDFDDFEEDAE